MYNILDNTSRGNPCSQDCLDTEEIVMISECPDIWGWKVHSKSCPTNKVSSFQGVLIGSAVCMDVCMYTVQLKHNFNLPSSSFLKEYTYIPDT